MLKRDLHCLTVNTRCICIKHVVIVLHISIELNFFTKYRDFLHAPCKKSLLDVKNLTVAFTVGIIWAEGQTKNTCTSGSK